MAERKTRPVEPRVTFWGAARSVTGSMHRVDACGRSVLLDCGLVQDSRSESLRRNREFPFRPKQIDAVLLSHAHLDHSGNLPNLVRQGFAGPIYCTPATRAVAAVILGDSAKVQEAEAALLNGRRNSGEPEVEPLYDERAVYRTLLRLKAIPCDTPFVVLPGLEATFSDAGHLLGSAMLSLRIDGPQGERRLTYTGDLGRPGLPILRDPAPVPAGDLLIAESTYGGRAHGSADETVERLGEVIRRTVDRGGKLLIPAFSVGRTQSLVYLLHQLLGAGRLPNVPIYVDGPMAVRATEVYRAHPECFDPPALRMLQEHPELFGEGRVTYVEKVHESLALNDEPGPCVIISASGMCEAGRVLFHLQRVVSDSRNTVLIAGYQAEGTLGRRIAERPPEVRILGRSYPLRAEVVALDGLSGHADHDELLRQLTPLAGTTAKVRLVHGELASATALAEALRKLGFGDVAVPERGESAVV
ncbi:MAG: MBL fold metallo-hydrolase [Planctomycetaceae bacterium]|nr:MBL fold metallo-hydrolase [Planctomycetaceae bacterium]